MKKSNNFSNVPKTLAPEEDEERNALIRKLDIYKFEFFNFSLPPLPGTKDEIDVAVVHGPSAYRRNKFDAHIWVGLLNGEYRRYLYSIEYSKKEYNPENYVEMALEIYQSDAFHEAFADYKNWLRRCSLDRFSANPQCVSP